MEGAGGIVRDATDARARRAVLVLSAEPRGCGLVCFPKDACCFVPSYRTGHFVYYMCMLTLLDIYCCTPLHNAYAFHSPIYHALFALVLIIVLQE